MKKKEVIKMYYQMNYYRSRANAVSSFTPSSFYMHTPNIMFESKENQHYDSGKVRMSFI